jgi:hypothetical protein
MVIGRAIRGLISPLGTAILSPIIVVIVGSIVEPIGSKIGNFFLENYAGVTFYNTIEHRQKGIEGTWIGNGEQLYKGKIKKIPNGRMKLNVDGRKINGELEIPVAPDEKEPSKLETFNVSGGFINGDFVKLEYKSTNESAIYFGTLILQLNSSGNKLEGGFVVNGIYSNKIVTGKVNLTKK